jgi:hypothetical protein
MITDNADEGTGVMVLYRIIGRHCWDKLQGLHESCPGSSVEHLMHALSVLHIPPAKSEEATA